MLEDSQPTRTAVRRTHRTYSAQFKAEMVAACLQPGASIAALALQHGMNTNVVHRWLKEHRQGLHRPDGAALAMRAIAHPALAAAFVPVRVDHSAPPPTAQQQTATPADFIRLECPRPGLTVTLQWPVSCAAQCARMLRDWLR